MTPVREKKVLTAFIRYMDEPKADLRGLAVWLVTAIAFGVLSELGETGRGPLHHPLVLILAGAVIGGMGAWKILLAVQARNWPAVRPYISRANVEMRIKELET